VIGRSDAFLRWLKFNLVGALGIAVQIAALFTLKSGLHLGYLLATGLAVEIAVLHNFLWHERYTWVGCVHRSWRESLRRLIRFNLSNGAISIAGNLILMKLIISFCRMHYLVANGLAISVCSLLNFLVCEKWVFCNRNSACI
jgi:putative flippase GtrA